MELSDMPLIAYGAVNKTTGQILVETIHTSERAVKVNWLVSARRVPIYARMTEQHIAELFHTELSSLAPDEMIEILPLEIKVGNGHPTH